MNLITTDKEISEYFGNTPKTLSVWKKSSDKRMNERYYAFRTRYLLDRNKINDPFALIAALQKEVEEKELAINEFVDKQEALLGVINERA